MTDLYQKKSNLSGQSEMPDLSNIEQMKPEEALKALEPLLKAFNAFASLNKIITLATTLEAAINNLNLTKNNLENDIKNLNNERNDLSITQNEVLKNMQLEHNNHIQKMTDENNKLMTEQLKLTNEKNILINQMNDYKTKILKDCNDECNNAILNKNTILERLQLEINAAESQLNKIQKAYESIKSKFI